jgi:triacylglycerol esterase/lipase EstA (alpha/beta hydrolase family)
MWNRIKSQFTRGETSPSDTQQEENFQATASSSQKHLIILANGLFSSRHNWNYISEVLHEHLDTEITLIHVSKANEFTATYAGIETCGHRLAAEINSIVVATPSLERISFIGHSMGGLIARYAAGELYNPQDQSIAGLKPTHYVSMATPHLECCNDFFFFLSVAKVSILIISYIATLQ